MPTAFFFFTHFDFNLSLGFYHLSLSGIVPDSVSCYFVLFLFWDRSVGLKSWKSFCICLKLKHMDTKCADNTWCAWWLQELIPPTSYAVEYFVEKVLCIWHKLVIHAMDVWCSQAPKFKIWESEAVAYGIYTICNALCFLNMNFIHVNPFWIVLMFWISVFFMWL